MSNRRLRTPGREYVHDGIEWLLKGVGETDARKIKPVMVLLASGTGISTGSAQLLIHTNQAREKVQAMVRLTGSVDPALQERIRTTLLTANESTRQQLLSCLVCPALPQNADRDFRPLGRLMLLVADQSLTPEPLAEAGSDQLRETARVRIFRCFPAVAPCLSILLDHCTITRGRKRSYIRIEPPEDYPASVVQRAVTALGFVRGFTGEQAPADSAEAMKSLTIVGRLRRKLKGIVPAIRRMKVFAEVNATATRITGLENLTALYKQLETLDSKNPGKLMREPRQINAAFDTKGNLPGLRDEHRRLARELLLEVGALENGGTPSPRAAAGGTALSRFRALPESDQELIVQQLAGEAPTAVFTGALILALQTSKVPSDIMAGMRLQWITQGVHPSVRRALSVLSNHWKIDFNKRGALRIFCPDTYPKATVDQAAAALGSEDAIADLRELSGCMDVRYLWEALYQLEELTANPSALSERPAPPRRVSQQAAPDISRDVAQIGVQAGTESTDAQARVVTAIPSPEQSVLSSCLQILNIRSLPTGDAWDGQRHLQALDRMASRGRQVQIATRNLVAVQDVESRVSDGFLISFVDRFRELVSVVQKAFPHHMDCHPERSLALTEHETAALQRFLVTVAEQSNRLAELLPAAGYPHLTDIDERVAECALQTAAVMHAQRVLASSFRAKIKAQPHVRDQINAATRALAGRLPLSLASGEGRGEYPILERLRTIIEGVELHADATEEGEESQGLPAGPLSLLLQNEGFDLAGTLSRTQSDANASVEGLSTTGILTAGPRRIVSRLIRSKFGNSRGIPLGEVAAFLAPAGIRLERVDTEHPYHFVCDLPGCAGRRVVTLRKEREGLYPLDIVETLFGKREAHGIGDINALLGAIKPDEMKD